MLDGFLGYIVTHFGIGEIKISEESIKLTFTTMTSGDIGWKIASKWVVKRWETFWGVVRCEIVGFDGYGFLVTKPMS